MAETSTAPSPVTPTRSPKLSIKNEEFQAQLRAVFNEFDADGSGSVDTAEIQAMTAKLAMTFSTEEIEAMVRDADSNGNGVLEFDEFEQVIKAHLGKGASANGLGSIFASRASSIFGAAWSSIVSITDVFESEPLKLRPGIAYERPPMQWPPPGMENEPRGAPKPPRPKSPTPGFSDEAALALAPPPSPPKLHVVAHVDVHKKEHTPTAEEIRLRAQAYKPPNNLLKGVPKAKFDDQFQARTFFSNQRVSSGTSRINPVQV